MPTRLKSLSTTGGFLEKCKVEFSEGLTCIIGARGTCKSTLVESIRFAFDCDQDRVKSLIGDPTGSSDPWTGMVKATLGAASVRCELGTGNEGANTSFVLEREVGGDTRIFQDGVREHAEHGVLHDIEIFSQGDLQRIADHRNDGLRLSLIDRPNAKEVSALRRSRETATRGLLELGPRLRAVRGLLSSLRQDLQPLPQLREDLAKAVKASPQLAPDLEKHRAEFERRRRTLETAQEIQALATEASKHLAPFRTLTDRIGALTKSIYEATDLKLDAIQPSVDAVLAASRQALAAAGQLSQSTLSSDTVKLQAQFELENEEYFRLRQGQQAVNESLKQQQHLQRQVELLEKRQRDLEASLGEEQQLLASRQALRTQVAAIDNDLYSLRIKEVDTINDEHSGTVHLTLRTGAGAPKFVERLSYLLGGSRIRFQEEVAAALADTFSPSALIDIAESGSGQRLAEVLGRDLGQMNRVVAHLGDHAELYSLEGELPAARLEITLFDNGDPKPVETLSKGQRATALLPLILRPLPYPLVFDQPEDDLDNHFIFSSLVKSILKLKSKRQLIFVTHNANIPVLGAADRVVVMHMTTPTLAAAPMTGSVDDRKKDVLDLLEGGAEAFRLREARYHELLNPVAE